MEDVRKIPKEELTFDELNSLCPDYGLFKGVSFEKVDYYKDFDTGKIYEVGYCTDGSLKERLNEVKRQQEKIKVLRDLGF